MTQGLAHTVDGVGLTFGSVCSGIEAASVAWLPLGWRCAFMSEIEAFPRAVLAHHYPETPLHGDFTTIKAGDYEPIDVLVGGTPCQSFSVAGLRGGLDDDRGNLALEYLRLADRLRPRWLVWENVPGVLSSNGGRDFGSILGGLVQLGYGFAYRVLDAQYFGLAQRRRRVFVVGHLGDWRRAGAVLIERSCLSGNPPPSREAGEGIAPSPTLRARANSSHRADSQAFIPAVSPTLRARDYKGPSSDGAALVAHTLRGQGFDASEDGAGRGTPIVPVAFMSNMSASHMTVAHDHTPTLRIGGDGGNSMAIAFNITPSNSNKDYNARASDRAQAVTAGGNRPSARGGDLVVPLQEVGKRTGASTDDIRAGIGMGQDGDPMFTLQAGAQHGVGAGSAVRRLTPKECERLQGFPDGYTDVTYRGKPAADGPRYKALGNSMAVPVMSWIGRRIAQVEAMVPHPSPDPSNGLPPNPNEGQP